MKKIAKALVSFVPLLLTPVLIGLIGAGHLDFGGGEKDLVWALIWAFAGLLFAGAGVTFALLGRTWRQWFISTTAVTLALLVLAALVLQLSGQLGIGFQ